MKLDHSRIITGTFLKRKNLFLAQVLAKKGKTYAHVPNSGRMKELLVEGSPVLLLRQDSPLRKTLFDLIMVWHGQILVYIDSRLPNFLVNEALATQKLNLFREFSFYKREAIVGKSRIDFLFQEDEKIGLLETKSVTLVKEGLALFPDAPTSRGRRHLKELAEASKRGAKAGIVFVVRY